MTVPRPTASSTANTAPPGRGQTLAGGAAGIALLHVERVGAGVARMGARALPRHRDGPRAPPGKSRRGRLFRGAPAVAPARTADRRPGWAASASTRPKLAQPAGHRERLAGVGEAGTLAAAAGRRRLPALAAALPGLLVIPPALRIIRTFSRSTSGSKPLGTACAGRRRRRRLAPPGPRAGHLRCRCRGAGTTARSPPLGRASAVLRSRTPAVGVVICAPAACR